MAFGRAMFTDGLAMFADLTGVANVQEAAARISVPGGGGRKVGAAPSRNACEHSCNTACMANIRRHSEGLAARRCNLVGHRSRSVGIARMLHVGKPTLYRWWKTKAAPVVAMFSERIVPELEAPRVTTLDDSIHETVDRLILVFNSFFGKVIAELAAEAQIDPAVP